MLKLELSLMFKGALWVLSSVSSVSGNHNFFKITFSFLPTSSQGDFNNWSTNLVIQENLFLISHF